MKHYTRQMFMQKIKDVKKCERPRIILLQCDNKGVYEVK